MIDAGRVIATLGETLATQGFKEVPPPLVDEARVLHAWVQKRWTTNRGVVLLALPDEDPSDVAPRIAVPLGRQLGYVPLIYGMGLQLIWLGRPASQGRRLRPLADGCHRYDNQRSIVQSQFVLDTDRGEVARGHTWGQTVTAPLQR